ncbi:MAG TPA: 16S rRNA (cytosine(1402)-N(4))-methyltransferase, partial [Candidatus Bathyarchaeia archaeon]|nr:16S rRNA (cytosine(1402)-N(4))-methyltransferase [Candidatus Bathyarchaeia archaeon]
MKKVIEHIPVMNQEVLTGLNCKPGNIALDCTLGLGGHARGLLEKIGPQGRLVGIDRDAQALAIARDRLSDVSGQCSFVHSDFRYVDRVLADLQIKTVDAILLDLGVSSMQLDDPQRGFS